MTLLQTDFLPTKSETFQAIRQMYYDMGLQPGVVNGSDYQPVQRGAGANMSVDVGAGSAWVGGASVARQGLYHQINDATTNVGPFGGSDLTNPRVDQLFLVVNDSSISGASDTPIFYIAQGTPTFGATQFNRLGAATDASIAAAHPNRIRVADVLIPANSSAITTANILDRRPWARGACAFITNAGGDIAIGGGNGILSANGYRLELSGAPVELWVGFAYVMGSLNANFTAAWWADGSSITGSNNDFFQFLESAQTGYASFPAHWFGYTPGSHLINVSCAISAGSPGTVRANSSQPVRAVIKEQVRQNTTQGTS